jgi:hypothetical protein
MPIEVETPLPTGIWLSELRKLAESCANDNAEAEDRAVRRAFHVLKLSPPAIARIWSANLSENDLEIMLEQGQASKAACEIVGRHASIKISDALGHRHVAVLKPDGDDPVSAEAASPALAMISAWATMLLAN